MQQNEANDDARLQEFESRIERGEKIEPGDWMPDGVSWLRSHKGEATHWRLRGGPTTESVATALLLASCRKCVHSSMLPGRALTILSHLPPRLMQATPSGARTRNSSSSGMRSGFCTTTRLIRLSVYGSVDVEYCSTETGP